MSLILNIDTALETAFVCLAENGEPLLALYNREQKDHASWLHNAIKDLLQKTSKTLPDLQAVAVSIGPGSYTGLRVGLSTAKGFCYALKIPLIATGTLEMMAFSLREAASDLICPLIDARRMEVYTAVYKNDLTLQIPPQALVLEPDSFDTLLSSHPILFCGSGAKKLQSILSNPNAGFSGLGDLAPALSELSHRSFVASNFADLAYTEPLYLKDLYSPARRD